VKPEEQIAIIDFYQLSNLRFREKLGSQGKSAEWTEWFRHAGIHDN
jgi:hypothetical protein